MAPANPAFSNDGEATNFSNFSVVDLRFTKRSKAVTVRVRASKTPYCCSFTFTRAPKNAHGTEVTTNGSVSFSERYPARLYMKHEIPAVMQFNVSAVVAITCGVTLQNDINAR